MKTGYQQKFHTAHFPAGTIFEARVARVTSDKPQLEQYRAVGVTVNRFGDWEVIAERHHTFEPVTPTPGKRSSPVRSYGESEVRMVGSTMVIHHTLHLQQVMRIVQRGVGKVKVIRQTGYLAISSFMAKYLIPSLMARPDALVKGKHRYVAKDDLMLLDMLFERHPAFRDVFATGHRIDIGQLTLAFNKLQIGVPSETGAMMFYNKKRTVKAIKQLLVTSKVSRSVMVKQSTTSMVSTLEHGSQVVTDILRQRPSLDFDGDRPFILGTDPMGADGDPLAGLIKDPEDKQ